MSEPNKPATVPSVDDVVLLPCPFCGGDAKLFNKGDREDRYDVGCSTEGCYVEGGAEWWHGDINTLVAMWNTRANATVRPGDDQQDSPVAWTIVSIGRDGSILCESPSGRRTRWAIECSLE